jgi:hypothetical protein
MQGWDTFTASILADQISFGALIGFVVLSIFRGWLVPGNLAKDRIRDKDTQIELTAQERDDWKAAYYSKSEECTELSRQNGELIDGGRTTKSVLEALRAQATQGPHTEGPDV